MRAVAHSPAMAIDPSLLAALAADYTKDMTSIRGRRVQRLLRRELAGADQVLRVQLVSGEASVLGLSSSGAALCTTDGTGPHAALLRWRHGSETVEETQHDLLKDSLPVLRTTRWERAQLGDRVRVQTPVGQNE